MENPNYKNENTEKNYLNNVEKSQFLKVKKNHSLELEKLFTELNHCELKDREVKIKREREELFLNRVDDVDNFKQKRNDKDKAN